MAAEKAGPSAVYMADSPALVLPDFAVSNSAVEAAGGEPSNVVMSFAIGSYGAESYAAENYAAARSGSRADVGQRPPKREDTAPRNRQRSKSRAASPLRRVCTLPHSL
jgi:hypothetical protein